MSLPKPRRFWFPLMAVGFAFAILGLLEAGLRLFGVAAFEPDPFVGFAGSHPFFVQVGHGAEARYQVNPRHQQFFNEVTFPVKKPKGSFRVFAAGGSVVMGFPFYDPGSFPRFLQIGLDLLDPVRPHEVINVGGFGYASYRIARVVEEALRYQPDLIVVMTGENEFLEKRVYGGLEVRSPFLAAVQSGLDRLRLYRLLRQTVAWLRPPGQPLLQEAVTWEKSVADRKQVELTLVHYGYNLGKIVRLCREQGVPLVLMTLPSNLKDFPPLQSRHRPDLSAQDQAQWEAYYRAGLQMQAAGDENAAAAELEAALRLDSGYADLHFALGRTLLAAGVAEAAAMEFWESVRRDAWPVRAFPEMNQAVEALAGRGAVVADALARFQDAATYRIPGNDLFLDHCHPTLPGQALLAESVLAALMQNHIIAFSENWQPSFASAARNYQARLGDPFLGEAYYRAAFEVGVNLSRPQEGLRLAETAKQLVPEHPKLPGLLARLRQALPAPSSSPKY